MPNWNNVEEFVDWYEANGSPIRPPQHNAIFRTNNASALVLYREGQFQVELYIGDPNCVTPEHRHPGIESMLVYLSGEGSTTINEAEVADPTPYFNKVNADGTSVLFKQRVRVDPVDSHGLTTYSKGFAFYSFEKWPEGVEPTSVTSHWEGETTGDIHDRVIEQVNKNVW
jgi:hypothetical protein